MRSNNNGFTLLELMLSIGMISVIVLITMGVMRLGYRSVDKGEEKIQSIERIRHSLYIMDSQIQSMFPLRSEKDGERTYYFKGEREFMQFATNYSIWKGMQGYVIVSYMAKDENGKKSIYASEKIIGTDNEKDVRLLTGIDSIYFEYFERDILEEEGKWVGKWTDNTKFPEKVRVHIAYGGMEVSMIMPLRARPVEEKEDGSN